MSEWNFFKKMTVNETVFSKKFFVYKRVYTFLKPWLLTKLSLLKKMYNFVFIMEYKYF